MRIALVHYTLPPVIGGVERIIAQHARLFHEHGHEVTLVAASGESDIGTFEQFSPAVHVLNGENLEQALRGILQNQDLVLIHNVCTMPFNLSLTEALVAEARALPSVRFVSWIHDIAAINPAYCETEAGSSPLLRSTPAELEFVAVSERRKLEWCELTGLSSNECQVIPNGVDPLSELGICGGIAAIARQHRVLERGHVFLQPTRLLRRKNVELTLDVAGGMKRRGVDAVFLVTGAADPHHAPSAEYRQELLLRIERECLGDSVILLSETTVIADADLPQLYAMADALFFPSVQEGFGLPMLEAALHRIPAFCLDIEPMRSLPGAVAIPLGLSPSDIAECLIRHLDAWPANLPRKAVIRNHGWTAIYTKFLARCSQRQTIESDHETCHSVCSDG